MIKICLSITVILPTERASADVVTSVCIAETVIVGEVPDAFTQVIPKDEDIETISSILSEGIYVMHFGGYVLYVKDQRKYLLPQEIIR